MKNFNVSFMVDDKMKEDIKETLKYLNKRKHRLNNISQAEFVRDAVQHQIDIYEHEKIEYENQFADLNISKREKFL